MNKFILIFCMPEFISIDVLEKKTERRYGAVVGRCETFSERCIRRYPRC